MTQQNKDGWVAVLWRHLCAEERTLGWLVLPSSGQGCLLMWACSMDWDWKPTCWRDLMGIQETRVEWEIGSLSSSQTQLLLDFQTKTLKELLKIMPAQHGIKLISYTTGLTRHYKFFSFRSTVPCRSYIAHKLTKLWRSMTRRSQLMRKS